MLTATLIACSGEGQILNDDDVGIEFGQAEEAVTLMDKPGTEAALATEAGQDIEQQGPYTVYSANGDSHSPTTYEGSVQLFKNGAPLASYQVRTPFPYTRIGYQVAMSENFIVTDVQNYPVAPGQLKNMVMIVGKTNGEFASCGAIGSNGALPNCVTCTGSPATWETQVSCTPKPGVSILELPPGFDSALTFELEGNELLAASRYGGDHIAVMKHNGSSWVFSGRINSPLSGEKIGGAMAISGNRLAVSATAADGVSKYIYVYERANSNATWRNVLRVNSPTPNVPKFGDRLDLSGNYLVASDRNDVHFIELGANLGNPGSAIVAGCTARVQADSADVAISGNRVVVAASQKLPLTFERTTSWNFFGGLPAGLFPDDVDPTTGNSTLQSLWGAAIDGNRAAIGWRNYRGDNVATATGAALGFDFAEYGCGTQVGLPGAGLVRARRLTIDAVNAPNHTGFPETNALDGSPSTRWRATAAGNTQFEIDFGELELLSHLELNWGSVYARDYLIQVSSDPDTVPAGQRTWDWLTHVTNGDGGTDFVVLRNNAQAFGRRLRLTLNAFSGTGDSGVSLTEFAAYGMVSSACSSKPTITCTTPATAVTPPHVCANDCGRQDENFGCFCDSACVSVGDCCSPTGTGSGAQYFSDLLQVCPDID
jgi:hypothetical protein